MTRERNTPWERLRRDMKDVFGGRGIDIDYGTEGRSGSTWYDDMEYPCVDIVESKDELIITLDMPGLEKEDIKINLTENDFEVKAEVREEELDEGEYVVRAERTYSGFYRKFSLPEEIVPEDASASYQHGVLKVTIPKSKDSRRRFLEIE